MERNTKRNRRTAGRTGGFMLALILLAGIMAVPVQAAALSADATAKEVKNVNLKKAKKIKLKNTKGKDKNEVAAIQKILEKVDGELLERCTDLNNKEVYLWSKGRLYGKDQ